jgi:predicted nucleic acid-binding protein
LRWTDPTGERAATKEEAEYIAYLRGIIGKEQAKPWHRRYSMGITALETYLERYEGAINLALDGQGIAGFNMEQELPVRVASGGFSSNPHEGFLINTAVEFEPDFKNYAVPVEAFDRQPLFFGRGSDLPSFARSSSGWSLIDNNILTRMAETRLPGGGSEPADLQALQFAARRSGRIAITETVAQQFLVRHSEAQLRQLQQQYGVRVLPDVGAREVQALQRQLGKTASGDFADTSILAAARRYQMSLVTADKGLLSSALRSGYKQVEFRLFRYSPEARAQRYATIRTEVVRQLAPEVDPNRVTGSPSRGPGQRYRFVPRALRGVR